MTAKEFLNDYSIDDLHIFGSHEEHYSLDDLLEEYAKEKVKDSKEVVGILQSIIRWGSIKDGRFTYTSSEQHINEIKILIEKLIKI